MNEDRSQRWSARAPSVPQCPTARQLGLGKAPSRAAAEDSPPDVFSRGERWRWCIGRATAEDVARAAALMDQMVDAGGFTAHAPMTEEEVVYLVKGMQAAGFDPLDHMHVLPAFEAIQLELAELARWHATRSGSRLSELRHSGYDLANVVAFPDPV